MCHHRALICLYAAIELGAFAAASFGQTVAYDYPAYYDDPAGKPYRVELSVSQNDAGRRTFILRSSAPQRDNVAATRTVTETEGWPDVKTGSPLFDALFALTIDDAKQASVESIRDWAYNGNQPIPCRCFETGEKWPFVWTRDLAYSLDLGLAGLDPDRAVNGLMFKTSAFRAGVPLPSSVSPAWIQIIQDTGSGGSWPVSTDRVAWALGAEAALAVLDDPQKADFARHALAALVGTLESDRLAAYDRRDGLYTGEHSFLDWREQTYAPWIANDLSALAQSKALSTNVLEYRALRLAVALAESAGDHPAARRYAAWAVALAKAINRTFWNPEAGLYATYTTADVDATPVSKYDLLGNSLAILSGLATPARARTILSRYPFAPFGPPVVWPEAPGIAVYHNRANWPFVTAYAMKAAARVRHVAAFDAGLASLMRSSALHLSNMENYEWLTGLSQYDDGPVVDSRRQLWSIAAFYGTVTGTVFGWHPRLDDIEIAPFLTSKTRDLFGPSAEASLTGLHFRQSDIDIVLKLPEQAADKSYYPVRTIRLNGTEVKGKLSAALLRPGKNVIAIEFGPARRSRTRLTQVPPVPSRSHSDPRVFLPAEPVIASIETNAAGKVHLVLKDPSVALRYTVYRDGRMIAKRLTGPVLTVAADKQPLASSCYAVTAVVSAGGHPSLASQPICLRGALAQDIAIGDPRLRSDAARLDASDGVAVPTLQLSLGRSVRIDDVVVRTAGLYAIRILYDNHIYAPNTGVTNAVKRLAIIGEAGAAQEAVVQMPQIAPEGAAHPLRHSTRAYFVLTPGRYRIEIGDFFNMSELLANASYDNPGGKDGPINQARIAAIEIDAVGSRRTGR